MPANHRRGEVEAVFDGRPRRLVLTLGSLAELEAAFGVADLAALAGRFDSGRISATDAAVILGAGLRGAGEEISDADVARLVSPEGAAGFVRAVVALLEAAFGGGEAQDHPEAGGEAQNPFLGTR